MVSSAADTAGQLLLSYHTRLDYTIKTTHETGFEIKNGQESGKQGMKRYCHYKNASGTAGRHILRSSSTRDDSMGTKEQDWLGAGSAGT